MLRDFFNQLDNFIPQIKGSVGEITISVFLHMLDNKKYKIVNNIILTNGTQTTQIDHIIVSNFGIFVIETKNYKGMILGEEKSQYWTQVLNGRKEKLYNPIKQNKAHIKAIIELFSDIPSVPVHSIIVFHPKAQLRINSTTPVGYPLDLLRIIYSYKDIVINDTCAQ